MRGHALVGGAEHDAARHRPPARPSAQPAAARVFRFVADPPTTTTQRLKSLATGSLPTFFDVSSSFAAGALRDDNLVDQLHAAGRKLVRCYSLGGRASGGALEWCCGHIQACDCLAGRAHVATAPTPPLPRAQAFVGDATWAQLFPTQFTWSSPQACFNIKDLHSVDDAVAAAMPGLLADPGRWDVLIAHYLGVDHAGHAHGVSSPEMLAKLRQLDGEVEAAARALVAGAGPGGPYARTLLLVAGDHGQTLEGDHGGGGPEEVDSALMAVDVAALREAWQTDAPPPAADASGWGYSACRERCTCGDEGNQCADDMLQIDLVPTLAALLGVPTPFGSLGKLSSELWALAAGRPGGGDTREEWEESLAAALHANADQARAATAAAACACEGSPPGGC